MGKAEAGAAPTPGPQPLGAAPVPSSPPVPLLRLLRATAAPETHKSLKSTQRRGSTRLIILLSAASECRNINNLLV